MGRQTTPVSLLAYSRKRCIKDAEKAELTVNVDELAEQIRRMISGGQGGQYTYGNRAAFDQIMFVRDRLASLWGINSDSEHNLSVACVSSHRSKSIDLPVYRLSIPRVGVIHLRNNFHDWKVSCELEFDVPVDLWGDLFDPHERISAIYCEGFDPSWMFPPLAESHSYDMKFTASIDSSNEVLYVFMWVLRAHAMKLGRIAASR